MTKRKQVTEVRRLANTARDMRALRRSAIKDRCLTTTARRQQREYFLCALKLTRRHLLSGHIDAAVFGLLCFYRERGELFTVSESEQLLMNSRNDLPSFYKFQNLVVAMCTEPWNVDTRLGGSGVCYFGNMAEVPNDAKKTEILARNRGELTSPRSSFFLVK